MVAGGGRGLRFARVAAVCVLLLSPVTGAVVAQFHGIPAIAGVFLGLLAGCAALCALLMVVSACVGMSLYLRGSLPMCRCGWTGACDTLSPEDRQLARKRKEFFSYRCPVCGMAFRREGRRVFALEDKGASRLHAELTLNQHWRLC